MSVLLRIAAFTAVGAVILSLNIWYFRALYESAFGRSIVIAPVKVYGANEKLVGLDEDLSQLLLSSIASIEWSLGQSQARLQMSAVNREDFLSSSSQSEILEENVPPHSIGIAELLGPVEPAGLNAQLFEPSNIEATVAGVDVGGLLPRVQRWFVQNKILALSASFVDENTVIVSGEISVLKSRDPRPFRMRINATARDTIAEEVAYELVRRRLSESNPFFERLEPDEFKILIGSVGRVAEINQRVEKYGILAKGEYLQVYNNIYPLAEEITSWSELNYFVASVAESAQEYSKAIILYERIQNLSTPTKALTEIDERIILLKRKSGLSETDPIKIALDRMNAYAGIATSKLNWLFGTDRTTPVVKIPPDNMLNAYWDGTSIFAPVEIADIPDIIYHEAAWPFITDNWKSLRYDGDQGTLVQSYTDVLASVVKQLELDQSAETADWVIGKGAVAWLKSEPNQIRTDNRPLRSLKNPGSAYDDPVLGKDQQVSRFNDLVGYETGSGIFINSGVPNKAFYETALRLGTETAVRIWIDSLSRFDSKTDLRSAAAAIYATTREKFGNQSEAAAAVRAAWNVVGLEL